VLSYFCWHCYAQNRLGSGPCATCGREIAAPPETSYDEQLLWALGHPLPDRRLIAVRVLGRRRVHRARDRLLELVFEPDPYLAAAALETLVALDGAGAHAALLERLRQAGPAPVRATAGDLLAGARGE
jgi:HEAT repeat protein